MFYIEHLHTQMHVLYLQYDDFRYGRNFFEVFGFRSKL